MSLKRSASSVRITRVSDLNADADEFEVERKPRALEVYGHVYDEITVRGVAEVRSHRDEDITLTVTKSLTGSNSAPAVVSYAYPSRPQPAWSCPPPPAPRSL